MAAELDQSPRGARPEGRRRARPYNAPAGGWGSVKSLVRALTRERVVASAPPALMRQNKPDGFACVSCAWAKPSEPHAFEFCENGAKATTWEITSRRAGDSFFASHTLRELEDWSDHDLEELGRLTRPMRWEAETDRYVPVAWDEAFRAIGDELKGFDPKSVVLYASGRASLEASYMYALFARLYGNNNLPDSSNMCHESTSVGLKAAIGAPVGTNVLDDFEHCDAILFFGQNVGSNSPRFLHPLQKCARRGVEIVTFNPLVERGLERFTNPQSPFQMAIGGETRISSQYHQVKAGGDLAAMTGIAKLLIAWDDAAKIEGSAPVLDHAFIAEHAHGFDAFADFCRQASWADIVKESGLALADIEAAARVYAHAKRTIFVYGMGLTQHVRGVQNVQMIVNLALLKGSIGREGAGICPVRGHSNVQGQRTVGISEKPELVPLDKLKAQFGFEPPREKGLNTVEACEGVLKGSVQAFIGLGGNFVRAIPDRERMEPAWRRMRLTVQIATKLNRSHLINGHVAYLLPCLGRIEEDVQASGPQAVSMEDSTSCIHGSVGERTPASPHLLSEPAIVAGIAKATLESNPKVRWDDWVGDYAKVRDLIEETYPDQFRAFNDRLFEPGGFYRGNPARERQWKTKSGKAEFNIPTHLNATGFEDEPDVMRMVTLRSNDQFNTTVYGYSDRFRGIEGTRMVVLMNREDIAAQGLEEGQEVTLATRYGDQQNRRLGGLRVTGYDIPRGCLGAYYPECNTLIPVGHHAEESFVPAAKSVPVTVEA